LHLHSYPSIYNLGHAAVADIFDGPVVIQEKVDGSQFSFGLVEGEYKCRSKGKDQSPPATDKMFELAVENTKVLPLHPSWQYRGEFLSKPKHNALAYDRVPQNNVVIFDIDRGLENYLPYNEMTIECHRLGLETVPLIFDKGLWIDGWEGLKAFLDSESFLGGKKIEGIVIKAYGRYGVDKKTLMAKYVSEDYKEAHDKEWKMANPIQSDVVHTLIERLRTPARWHKAIQHLRDSGELTMSPKDIGPLLQEVQADIKEEESERIKAALFGWAWPKISRAVIAGFPEFYKEWLAEQQFEEGKTRNDR